MDTSDSMIEFRSPSTPLEETAAEMAAELRRRIVSGEFRSGERIASIRELTSRTGLSYRCVARALELLVEDGLVEQRQGSGTYVREGVGRGPRSSSGHKRIGVIPPLWAPTDTHYFVGAVMHGIGFEAERHGYHVEFLASRESRKLSYADALVRRGMDGVIFIQPFIQIPPSLVSLHVSGVAVVTTGREYADVPAPCVKADDATLGKLVAEYMMHHGREKLICLVGAKNDLYTRQKVDAIRAALHKRGLELPEERVLTAHFADSQFVDWRLLIRSFLEKQPDFDAVFSLMDTDYLDPLMDLHDSGRRRCPDDFVLIEFAQSQTPLRAVWPNRAMAYIHPPFEAIGRQAVRELERFWGLDEPSVEPLDLSPTLEESRAMTNPFPGMKGGVGRRKLLPAAAT